MVGTVGRIVGNDKSRSSGSYPPDTPEASIQSVGFVSLTKMPDENHCARAALGHRREHCHYLPDILVLVTVDVAAQKSAEWIKHDQPRLHLEHGFFKGR